MVLDKIQTKGKQLYNFAKDDILIESIESGRRKARKLWKIVFQGWR